VEYWGDRLNRTGGRRQGDRAAEDRSRRLKVYCAGPMRAGGRYVDRFHEMVRIVGELGHEALSELSNSVEWGTAPELTRGADGGRPAGLRPRGRNGEGISPGRFPPGPDGAAASEDAYIYTRDIFWLDLADVLVAEVSGPSLGVGYEISYAIHVRKLPVLCLLNRDVLSFSAMIGGNTSPLLRVEPYASAPEMQRVIKGFLNRPGTLRESPLPIP